MTQDEERLLRRAIELAAAARAGGNPPFGSLLAGPDGRVLAEEQNTTLTDADISAHPELKLARWAARELDPATAATTTMYTSCQPLQHVHGGDPAVRARPRRVRPLRGAVHRPQTGRRLAACAA
ncbi:hypothetical protein [Nonomuraea sp. NPDC049400]|uniref:hypothetical protein n=1 Tax=Nonomuraea sp. NPDC049400 TaxID=3364352 RepID=UPI0037A0C29A